MKINQTIPLNFETELDEKSILNNYRSDAILIKTSLLKEIIEKEGLLELVNKDSNTKFQEKNSWLSSLKIDIHFSMFHAIETLFTLMFVTLDNKENFWIEVSNFSPGKLFNKIKESYENNFFTDEVIMSLFYPHIRKDYHEKIKNNKQALENIKLFLKGISIEFLDKEEYNAYKHGCRFIHGTTRLVITDSKLNDKEEIASQTSLLYPKRENGKLYHKLFDYKSDFEIIRICYHLVNLIISERKIHYGLVKEDFEIQTTNFSQEDIPQIMENRRIFLYFIDKEQQ